MNSRKQYLKVFLVDCHVICFPQECTGTRSPEVWLDVSQGNYHAGMQHRPCGEQVLRRRETSCTKLGECEANIIITNSLACVSTLLRGVQHKRTENNCLAWGTYRAHDGSVQWNHCAL